MMLVVSRAAICLCYRLDPDCCRTCPERNFSGSSPDISSCWPGNQCRIIDRDFKDYLGRKATFIYLIAIVIISFLAGIFVNHLYGYLGLDIRNWVSHATHEEGGVFEIVSSILLVVLVVKSFFPSKSLCCASGHDHHDEPHDHHSSYGGGAEEDHLQCGCGK